MVVYLNDGIKSITINNSNQCGSKCGLQLWVSTIDHVFQQTFKEWFLPFLFMHVKPLVSFEHVIF